MEIARGVMGVIDTAKEIVKLVQQLDNIELTQKIMELQAQIMDLLNENYSLKAEARELRDNSNFANSLVFRGNRYTRETETGEDNYCSKCWDADRKAMRLQLLSDGALYCPNCKKLAPGTRKQSLRRMY